MKEYGDAKEMSDTEYLSMKQIADQLNVSKQRVYRCIKSNCISEAHHEVVKQRIKELEEKPTEPESTDQEELAKDGFLKKLLKKYFNP